MAKEYVEESENVALYNGYGESYDHEAATLEAIHDAGVEEGIEQAKKENAINLYKNGVSKEIICDSLHITIEELEEIL